MIAKSPNAPLKSLHTRNVNAEVLRGMNRCSPRLEDLVAWRLPKLLHLFGADFGITRFVKTRHRMQMSPHAGDARRVNFFEPRHLMKAFIYRSLKAELGEAA